MRAILLLGLLLVGCDTGEYTRSVQADVVADAAPDATATAVAAIDAAPDAPLMTYWATIDAQTETAATKSCDEQCQDTGGQCLERGCMGVTVVDATNGIPTSFFCDAQITLHVRELDWDCCCAK